jgi:Lamin Tail Domain
MEEMVKLMKYIYSIICIAVIFSMTSSAFAQSMSTTGTTSQQGFADGIPAGIGQGSSTSETPFQMGFETGIGQPMSTSFRAGVKTANTNSQPVSGGQTAGYNVTISNAFKEGDYLAVVVANDGTAPANLMDWKLTLNKGVSTYIFPNFAINPNTIITIHANASSNTATDLFGSNFPWNGTRTVELLDQTGTLVSEYTLPAL